MRRGVRNMISSQSIFKNSTDTLLVAPEEAPTGMIARGHYNAISKFIDDDNHTHLEFEWSFDITKDWK